MASISRTADVTCFKWFRKHRRLARKRKMPIDSLGQFDATEISNVGLKSLCQRDREIISLCRLPLPSAAVQFIDTSQRYEHTSVPKPGVTPCATPHGTLFECSDVRESLGAEKLRFQSAFYPPIIERHLEDANLDEQRLLGNLGGNAFEGRSAGCVFSCVVDFRIRIRVCLNNSVGPSQCVFLVCLCLGPRCCYYYSSTAIELPIKWINPHCHPIQS